LAVCSYSASQALQDEEVTDFAHQGFAQVSGYRRPLLEYLDGKEKRLTLFPKKFASKMNLSSQIFVLDDEQFVITE